MIYYLNLSFFVFLDILVFRCTISDRVDRYLNTSYYIYIYNIYMYINVICEYWIENFFFMMFDFFLC